MHQVLMVAYHFPPAGGGGVQRTAKFARYLPEFGWQPVVLTVRADAYDLEDESLLADISDTFPIVRTPIARPWLINDIGIRWLSHLLKSASQIFFHENNIKVAYLTGNPFFPFLVGSYISKRFQVPYVLDFRDAWTLDPYLKPVTSQGRIARRLAILIEKQVIRQASKVVCVCEPMREDFVRSYPHEPAAKFGDPQRV